MGGAGRKNAGRIWARVVTRAHIMMLKSTLAKPNESGHMQRDWEPSNLPRAKYHGLVETFTLNMEFLLLLPVLRLFLDPFWLLARSS